MRFKAVERKDLFGDGTVLCDYYPLKKVELRVEGFKIVIWKPYCAPACYGYGKDKYYKGPKLYMSTNGTVELNTDSFALFQKAVQAVISILNSERINLINVSDFCKTGIVSKSDIPDDIKNAKFIDKTKYIKYDNNDIGSLITDIKGNKYIYLGKGLLYREDRLDNRKDCNEIYLSLSGKESITVKDNILH